MKQLSSLLSVVKPPEQQNSKGFAVITPERCEIVAVPRAGHIDLRT
jgi:hypothetical protein